ncbi:hypothetical protein BpHYR1_049116 [Brachionus plicatilis]|uniref:Uncharacterized protein n=1 Tax=Brachionus plicatilis TaxID=10195 RepID=A0A3M7P5G6_BRAPC|nr:hypothetical protein BpHYR1_049116 [Brachionus plicatilis]
MNQTERNLILELYSKTSDEILNTEIILYSNRALIQGREYHTFNYDEKFDSTNSHTIEYNERENRKKYFGRILKFIQVRENQFCLVKRYLQINKDSFFKKLSIECAKYIDKFFQIVELTDDSFLVDFLNIKRRCIVMNCEGQMVMSMIDDLEEMD